jgi:hypothetical protein
MALAADVFVKGHRLVITESFAESIMQFGLDHKSMALSGDILSSLLQRSTTTGMLFLNVLTRLKPVFFP